MAKAKKSSNPTATAPVAEAVASEVPEFNLNVGSLDYSDDAQLQEDLEKSGGKYFDEPGNVDLVVTAADFHKNKETLSIWCPGDSTWFNVKVSYKGPGDKEIDHWVQVPTTKIKFGKKDTLAVFKKLQQFFFSLGEEVSLNNLGALCKKYFADPSVLIGKKVNADLGYEGPYVGKLPNSANYGIFVRNEPLKEDDAIMEWPDSGSARNAAKGKGIEPGFVRIVKFTAKTATKKAGPASPVAAGKKETKPAPKPEAKAAPVKKKAKPAPVVEETEEEETEEVAEETEESDETW